MLTNLVIVDAIGRGNLTYVHRVFVGALLNGDGTAARGLPSSTLGPVRYAIELNRTRSRLPLPSHGWTVWQRAYWAWINESAPDRELSIAIKALTPETEGDELVLSGLLTAPTAGYPSLLLTGTIRRLSRAAADRDAAAAAFLEELLTLLRGERMDEEYARWLDAVAAEGLAELEAKFRRQDG